MPKLGAEPVRRAALVDATIAEIGETGNLQVTVTQIARRAGMSSALAHHYFGSKTQIMIAAMRHILTVYSAKVRGALIMASSDKERAQAIIRSSFSQTSFRHEVISAWLNFYVMALFDPDAKRLLTVYQKRIRRNLTHALKARLGHDASQAADRIAALIDGIYLRSVLGQDPMNRSTAVQEALAQLEMEWQSAPSNNHQGNT